MHAQPLAPADFEFIDATLLKYGEDHSVLNMAELDGYFTALVSSPAKVD
ncbi:YecA family protein, partial [Pseudomonas sp. PA-7-1E]|nr:YecA family protein [Pseudomonas sp. PA-7-1E]MCF5133475.1 YecA family protein [Pseudomonas sp. PA-6-4F]